MRMYLDNHTLCTLSYILTLCNNYTNVEQSGGLLKSIASFRIFLMGKKTDDDLGHVI